MYSVHRLTDLCKIKLVKIEVDLQNERLKNLLLINLTSELNLADFQIKCKCGINL